MNCYHHTLHRREWGNYLLARISKWLPLPELLKYILGFYSFLIINYLFFPTFFIIHKGSTSNPCCYWIFLLSHLFFSFFSSFSSSSFYYLHALPSWLFLCCSPPYTLPFLELVSRREKRDFFRSDFKSNHWGVWGSVLETEAELGGWTELSPLLKLWT